MEGLLATDAAQAVDRLERSAAAFGPSRFDRARAQLHAAQRADAAGLPQRTAALAGATGTFAALGASGLATLARDLGDTSLDGIAVLGPTRRAVVMAAAQGRRNAEIAAELSLSVRTVENHLHRAYRMLGVRSRTELVRLVDEMTP